MNRQLKLGRYFFVDIIKDGIALYEAPGHAFDAPEKLTPEAALAEAQGYFYTWMAKAQSAQKIASFAIREEEEKDAAFLLHQTVERLYHCFLLVQTLYSPKSHRLNFLRSQAEQLEPSLALAWPRQSKFEQRCFELLRRAYIDARYSPHFRISEEELNWLAARTESLRTAVESICEARLADLRGPA